ncbi:helix-turn-helix domain-containing protein [Clostridium botulinum]|uniref:helix-turn-helix domain-containing protein n=1 Tax=Clostridium sp. ZBS18 TaxID=2949967 RepID=UPI001DDB4863|nr:helix-turn-helix domain-containing protein [Clostridium sp. ZBS18]MBN1054939.1 helix-turn-helix domain-containing protein [Clostridium botulinum]
MSRKTKCSLEEKLSRVTEYLSGEKSVIQICNQMAIHRATFYDWLKRYNDIGEASLIVSTQNK